jgi:hypothetical protein
VKEQFLLAIKLGNRQTLTAPPENPFPSYCQAMDYFAKARQIAEKLNNPLLIQKSYQSAARLLLKSALDTGSFRERLGQARRRSQVEKFGNILSKLEHLKSFCCEEREKEVVRAFYQQARQIFAEIPVGQKNRYAVFVDRMREGRRCRFPLSDHYPTQTYREAFRNLRSQFTGVPSQESEMREFQTLVTPNIY